MPFTYTPNVPLGTQSVSETQPTINNNFQAISELININHVNFQSVSSSTDFGKHKFIQMPEQSTTPLTGVFETAIYANPYVATYDGTLLTSKTQTFFQPASSSTPSPGTAKSNNVIGSLVDWQTPGWTFLPSGDLMKWGYVTVPAPMVPLGTNRFVTFSGPAFTRIYNIQLTIVKAVSVGGSVPFIKVWVVADGSFADPTVSKFYYSTNISSAGADSTFYYFVMGSGV